MCSELNNILSFVQVDKEPLTVKVGHLKASCLYYVFFPNGMIVGVKSLIHIFIFHFSGIYSILQDKPYNKDDDVIKATSFEVKSTLSDVLDTRSYLKRTCTKVCSLFSGLALRVLFYVVCL